MNKALLFMMCFPIVPFSSVSVLTVFHLILVLCFFIEFPWFCTCEMAFLHNWWWNFDHVLTWIHSLFPSEMIFLRHSGGEIKVWWKLKRWSWLKIPCTGNPQCYHVLTQSMGLMRTMMLEVFSTYLPRCKGWNTCMRKHILDIMGLHVDENI